MSPPVRLLLADDHPILREGLKQLFALSSRVTVVGETTDGSQTLERLEGAEVDLLLLDMTMPPPNGEELILRIRARHPGLPILILTMHNDAQIARRALTAGASGYLTKDSDPELLMEAIGRVAAGQRFLDPALAENMAFASAAVADGSDHDCLTARELEVLRLLAEGMTVNEIAARLAISNKTVSTHKARMMEKMGFSSNAELVRYAILHGLDI